MSKVRYSKKVRGRRRLHDAGNETPKQNRHGIPTDKIILGDAKSILKSFPDACVDFIFTSPPYADRRKHTYGGILPSKYVAWFTSIAEELHRVLKDDGSF